MGPIDVNVSEQWGAVTRMEPAGTELVQLILGTRAGDIGSYATIVQRFQDMAVGYGFAILHDWQLAEDAAQEAFVSAYLELADLRDPAAFPGWFRRILFKQIDRIRRKRTPALSLEQIPAAADSQHEPSEILAQQEVRDEVLRAIFCLPAQQREVVTLYHISEYSYAEISAFLDVPPATIKMRLYHARKKLKAHLLCLIEEDLATQRPSSSSTFREKLMSFQIQVRTIPAQQILSISRHATVRDLQAHLDGGIKTLLVYAQSESKYGQTQDVAVDGLPFAIYHKRDPADELLVEICLPVKGSIAPTHEIGVKEVPAAEVVYTAATLRQSIFPGVLQAYAAIEQWFVASNHEMAGPPREVYLNYDHSIFSAAAKWDDPCLEIAWPLQGSD